MHTEGALAVPFFWLGLFVFNLNKANFVDMPMPKEIFRTDGGCIYQDDQRSCFILEYGGYATSLSVTCFFCLKKQIDRVDIDAMLHDTSAESDIAIISPHGCDRFFALTVAELLDIRELFAGTRVMLELNSILQTRIYTTVLS
jgi:hypothetical protein